MTDLKKRIGITLESESQQNELIQTETTQIQPIQQNELIEYNNSYKEALKKDPRVQSLTSEIAIDDINTILYFGEEASKTLTSISDNLLRQMKTVKTEESGELIVQLTKIMDKFDSKEIKELTIEKEPSFFEKIFNNTKNSLEKLFKKYENLGVETDKIYGILKQYEADIKKSNVDLERLAKANIETYENLEKYIVAGELAIEEVNKHIEVYAEKAKDETDQKSAMIHNNLLRAKDLLEQRIYDLTIAENVALQSIPTIQMIQLGNFNLIRKINSAFIITLPIFKQALTQAIMLKRQDLQARSMKALDDKTNELLLRNAQNVSKNSTTLARMAGTSSIKMETLEQTWQTIMNGIKETKDIQVQNKVERERNVIRLEEFKNKMLKTDTSL